MRFGPWPLGLLLAVGGCQVSATGTAVPRTDTPADHDEAEAWNTLRTQLPGWWRAELDGQPIDVAYRPSAAGTVIVETWMPGTAAETLTVYHLDGDRPMLTHYCGQGNQPRLAMVRSEADAVSFQRFDVTSESDRTAILTSLTLDMSGQTLRRIETYAQGSERETTKLTFRRLDGRERR